ncbi:endonuclease/exonuclease/phosphatase family protein [Agathobaculum sp.]|uniref:endonuclease/exonuclease/phosphatase family protein n=1 Tax=Agathobaculum sp. TaxID=2048138 RepID=UPI0025C40EEB|nr:endonuclease/exonuclease/phosphatase family protein [Agathobaculum sp.]
MQVLKDIIHDYPDAPHFFAIQEAGANPTLHQKLASIAYKQLWCAPSQAKNERCTLGILVPADIKCHLCYIKCSTIRNIACCDLEAPSIRIGCIHAIAERHAATEEVKAVQQALRRFNRPFILAGDMNSAPIASASSGIKLLHSGQATHQSENELDYFFASSSIHADDPFVYPVAPSDHNPVILKVRIV